MHANQPQRNKSHIHFEGKSNSSGRRDSDLNEVGRLDAFRIKLLNLAQIYDVIKIVIIPYYLQITRDHLKQDPYDIYKKNLETSQRHQLLHLLRKSLNKALYI